MSKKNDADQPELFTALGNYLSCPCEYFAPMKDDAPLMAAYYAARERGQREGFIPLLIVADETLWECLVMNSDQDSDGAEDYFFDADKVADYRKTMLGVSVGDGKNKLDKILEDRKEEAQEDDMDWTNEILGEMSGGERNDRFLGYWDYQTSKTLPLILAEVPAVLPYEIFAYLPFGGWNDCPDTPVLMAVAKYWFEKHGAVPAVMTHDVLEFSLPAPVPKEQAMELAQEQYAFCQDCVDQGIESGTVGTLADSLQQSNMWYFWWD